MTFLLAMMLAGLDDPVAVRLAVRPEAPKSIDVELRAAFGQAAGRRLRIARGVVGGYEEVEWRPFVEQLAAWNEDGEELAVVEDGGSAWVLSGEGDLARVSYCVDVARQERELEDAGASSRVRPDYAFLNGYGLILLVEGAEARAHALELDLPAGWRVATALPRAGDGRLFARSGAELLDEPLMIGTAFESVAFEDVAFEDTAFPDLAPGRAVHLRVEGELDPAPLLELLRGAAADSAAAIDALDLPTLPGDYEFFFELFAEDAEAQLGWAIERGRSTHGVGGARARCRRTARPITWRTTSCTPGCRAGCTRARCTPRAC